jgi:hypothetical protein
MQGYSIDAYSMLVTLNSMHRDIYRYTVAWAAIIASA